MTHIGIPGRLEPLSALADAELLASIAHAVRRAFDSDLDVLYHLIEIEKRRLHVQRSYGSLFEYVTKGLGMSEGSAQRRIAASRAIARYETIHEALLERHLTITTVALLWRLLRQREGSPQLAVELVSKASGKTQREVESLVASYLPPEAVRDRVTPVAIREGPVAAPAKRRPGAAVAVAPALVVTRPADEPALSAPPLERTDSEMRFKITFGASAGFQEKLETARSLLSGKFPAGATLEQVFETALDDYLERRSPEARARRRAARAARRAERRREAEPPAGGRPAESVSENVATAREVSEVENVTSEVAPPSLRDEIFLRDGGRCTYVGCDGRPCDSTSGHPLHAERVNGSWRSTTSCRSRWGAEPRERISASSAELTISRRPGSRSGPTSSKKRSRRRGGRASSASPPPLWR